jgi:hypothetical protein
MTALVLRPLFLLLLALVALPASTWASQWVASVDERSGLPMLTRGGSPVVSSTFAFWGSNWSWSHLQTAFTVNAPYRYLLTGENKTLDFDLGAEIQKEGQRKLVWDFTLDARSRIQDIIGGGIVFKFDLDNLADEMGEPQLLPDNGGWAWANASGSTHIEMRFEPALVALYFERGNKAELRALFFKDAIAPGSQRIKATLSVTSDVALGPTSTERFGLADPTTWPTDKVDWKTSPVDLSFLNAPEKPAGKRGFVKASGEQLRFADNTPARFWGTNLSAYTLFTTPDDVIKQQARRLSMLGFNLVRLHHHDSPWVNPNIFGARATTQDTQQLSAESLAKLDWWIKCLKDEGIYVWLDLHVERALMPADKIMGFDEIRKGENVASLKGYAYVNITMQQAMKRFAEAYVSHVNPHTGLAYKDDPAIAALLITNENDITHHFGNALLPDKKVPTHSQIYMAEADAFASQYNLPQSLTWRAWEHGPAKLFLNDLERRFNVEMIQHLRQLGVKVPIVTTSTWGLNGLSSLPALTAGDAIDVHSYGGTGQLEKNPLTSEGLLHWIAAGQVVGKPLTVTEWNAEPFPTPDRHTLPLYMAGMASHQGWDALMQYAYSQERLTEGWRTASNWHAYNDPGLLATLPAAALMYRRGDVREATTSYIFAPAAATLFGQRITPANAAALRTAAEKGKLQIAMPQTEELPWLQRSPIPANAQVLQDPNHSLLEANATEVISDTGELTRNWQKGIYRIDTALTQAATGWIGGEALTLSDIEILAKTPYASVAVQSLDGAPLKQSRHMLISLGTRAIPKDVKKTPFYTEPLEGTLSIKAPPGLKLFTHDILAHQTELPVSYENGRYRITFDRTRMSNWLFLRIGHQPSSSGLQ